HLIKSQVLYQLSYGLFRGPFCLGTSARLSNLTAAGGRPRPATVAAGPYAGAVSASCTRLFPREQTARRRHCIPRSTLRRVPSRPTRDRTTRMAVIANFGGNGRLDPPVLELRTAKNRQATLTKQQAWDFRFAEYEIDVGRHELRRSGEIVPIEP